MNTTALTRVREQSQWVRHFAQQHHHIFAPSPEQVRQAIAVHLPEQLLKYSPNAEAEELLEEVLGIAVIVRLGSQQIAWSIADDPNLAQALQKNYSATVYSDIRADLGIDLHWILLVNPELMFTVQDLYEAHMDLIELKVQPECVVMPV